MKKFILKIFGFALILVIILSIIKSTVPFYWGRSPGTLLKENSAKALLEKKMKHLLEESTNYNVLFFGSSRTYRHIDPLLFDSITGLNSFNVGIGGCFNLEANYLIDKFIEKKVIDDSLIIIIQEILPSKIEDKNLHSVPSKYYLDYKRLKMGISYYLKKKDYKQIYNHLLSYLENQLCIGEIRMILHNSYSMSSASKYYKSNYDHVVLKNKGFLSTDEHLLWPKTKYLKRRRIEYLKSEKYIKNTLRAKDIRALSLSEYYDHGIDIKDKKIKFYIIPKFDLDKEFHFDKGHYNNKGARIITNQIARYFLSK